MIDQQTGHRPGLRVVGHSKRSGGLDQEIRGFDVVPERVVRRNRPPVGGQIEIERPRLDGDAVSHDQEDFAQPLCHERPPVGPGKLGQCL